MPLFSNLLFINWETEHDCRYHNCRGSLQYPHSWRSEEGSLWGMPGRESNMGLPHSRRTCYFLSCVAPLPELRRTLAELRRTLAELRRTLSELRRTLSELRRTLPYQSYAALYLTQVRRSLLSYAAAQWAMPHHLRTPHPNE